MVAVTASGPSGGIAPYANRGSFVQIIAPGDNVVPFDGENYMVEGTLNFHRHHQRGGGGAGGHRSCLCGPGQGVAPKIRHPRARPEPLKNKMRPGALSFRGGNHHAGGNVLARRGRVLLARL